MEQFTNNATTTLNGTINNSVTSLVVTSATGFPTSANFRILIEDEILLVTAVAGTTYTVTRAMEGTAATTHNSGTTIYHLYTKGGIEQLLSDYDQYGAYASRPATPYAGTTYTATDIDAKWFFDGTNWNLIHPYIVPYARRVDSSGWTALNQGSNTFTERNNILYGNVSASGTNARGFYKTKPSAPFKATVLIGPQKSGLVTGMSLAFRENSTGKLRPFWALSTQPGRLTYEVWATESNPTSAISGPRPYSATGPTWLRIEDDNTNWIMSTSRDGKNYTRYYSETRNTGFTADKIAILWFNSVTYTTSPVGVPIYSYWEE